jgi:integrase/recombinase XerD
MQLETFKQWLLKDRKLSTVNTTLYSLKRLLILKQITVPNVTSYLLDLKEKGAKGKYLNHFVTAARLYGQFTENKELQKIPFFKVEPFVKATLSDEEIETFLSLKPWTYTQNIEDFHRWTLFFSIIAYTGMRPGEVANLTVEDVDFGKNIFLADGKTGPRYVPIPPNLIKELQNYLLLCRKFLFPAPRNGENHSVSRASWVYNFSVRAKKLGLRRKNLSVYSLRHSFITRLLEEDINIFKVQKIVGHRQIETTAQYTHLTTRDICEAIKKHPLIRRTTDPKSIFQSLEETIRKYALDQDERLDAVRVQQAISNFIIALYAAVRN